MTLIGPVLAIGLFAAFVIFSTFHVYRYLRRHVASSIAIILSLLVVLAAIAAVVFLAVIASLGPGRK